MKYLEKIKKVIIDMEDDFIRFYEKSNMAAGTRIRKGLQDLKLHAQEARAEIQGIKNHNSKQKEKSKKK